MNISKAFSFFVLLSFFFSSFTIAGKNAPKKDTCNYKLFDKDGKPVKLSEFKGKVLYIDFWASWCAGCKIIMQQSKQLHDKFTKQQLKKIVFIYISVDNDSAVWQKTVKELDLKGVHLLSPSVLEDGAKNYFRVTGLPRYMIINKKGEIGAFIAKTPQQKEAYDEIMSFVNQ